MKLKIVLLLLVTLILNSVAYAISKTGYNGKLPKMPKYTGVYDESEDDEFIKSPDFSTMTPLSCQYTVYMKPINSNSGWTVDNIIKIFYLDVNNKNIYLENKSEVSTLKEFSESEIHFSTTDNGNKRTTIRNYNIDRYTGRIYVNGTIRHQYGALASLTYDNIDFSGKGFCKAGEKGPKF